MKEQHFVGQKSKPGNSDFYPNKVFCQPHGTHSVKFSSSKPIRTPLQSINHASKYGIYERYHYFGAHFTDI